MPDLISPAELVASNPSLAGAADLADLAADASDLVRAHCRRELHQAARVRRYARTHRPRLLLREYPVASIASVAVDGQILAPSAYQLDAEAGILHRLDAPNWAASTPLGIEVADTAGYAAIPAPIRRACRILAAMLARESGDAQGLRRLRVRDHEEEWQPLPAGSLPPVVEMLLNHYVRPLDGR